jgi:hypothetical protein
LIVTADLTYAGDEKFLNLGLSKNILAVCFLLICFAAIAQKKPLGTGGSVAFVQNPVSILNEDCIQKKISIVFYVIQDSSLSIPPGTGTIMPLLNQAIVDLNQVFSKICIVFENCSTVVIPDYNYNAWIAGTSDSTIFNNFYTAKTLNVYLPKFINASPLDGYTYCSPTPGLNSVPKDYIVVTFGSLFIPIPTIYDIPRAALMHAFGHYFGLPETSRELGPPANPPPPPPVLNGLSIVSHEYSDGSNSTINGDMTEDTEADPYPGDANPYPSPPLYQCRCDHRQKDGKGEFYFPPVDNLMSQWTCRCRFTPLQYNKMANFIRAYRMHLH